MSRPLQLGQLMSLLYRLLLLSHVVAHIKLRMSTWSINENGGGGCGESPNDGDDEFLLAKVFVLVD